MKSVVFGFALSVASASQFPVNLCLSLSVQDLHHLTSPLRQPVTYFPSGTLTIPTYTLRQWCYPRWCCLTQNPCNRCTPSHTTYGKVTISGLPPWTLHPQTHHLQWHFSSPFSRTVNCLLPSSVLSLLVPGPFLCFLGKTMLGLYYFLPGRNLYQRLLEPGVVFWHSRSHSPQLWKQGGCIKDLVKGVLSSASMCSGIGECAGLWAVYQRPWRTWSSLLQQPSITNSSRARGGTAQAPPTQAGILPDLILCKSCTCCGHGRRIWKIQTARGGACIWRVLTAQDKDVSRVLTAAEPAHTRTAVLYRTTFNYKFNFPNSYGIIQIFYFSLHPFRQSVSFEEFVYFMQVRKLTLVNYSYLPLYYLW